MSRRARPPYRLAVGDPVRIEFGFGALADEIVVDGAVVRAAGDGDGPVVAIAEVIVAWNFIMGLVLPFVGVDGAAEELVLLEELRGGQVDARAGFEGIERRANLGEHADGVAEVLP